MSGLGALTPEAGARACASHDRQRAIAAGGRSDANVALEIQRISGMDRPDLSAQERLDEHATLSVSYATTSTRC
jgi:hypothetical protein